MAVTAQSIVDAVRLEVGFDATEAQVLAWLNGRHKAMVARSRCFRKSLAVGNTVIGTSFYALDVIELYNLEVGGVPYMKARRPDIYGYSQGTLLWTGKGTTGLIVADASSAGVRGISLVPTPTAVQAIVAYAAVAAPNLALADNVLPDDDFAEALIDATAATGYKRDTERMELAAPFEQMFTDACEELRRRVQRRYRGPGPTQIRVIGVNA